MVSLADLRARNVQPSWQESVAVVQELLTGIGQSPDLLPDLAHIALIPNGDVVALPGSDRPEQPVRHVARLLQILLDGVNPPPELEAFVARNVTASPQAEGLEDFARSLSYFERPGRRADVERLVARATDAHAMAKAEAELRRLQDKTVEMAGATTIFDAKPVVRRERPSVPAPLVIGALVLVLLAGGAYLVRGLLFGGGAAPAATSASASVPDAAAPAGDATPASGDRSAAAAAPGATGQATPASGSLLDRTAAAVRDAVESLIPRQTIVRPADPAPAAPDPAPAPAPRRRAAPAPVPATTSEVSVVAASRAPAPETVAEEPLLPEPATIARATASYTTVYSAGDLEVEAPVLVRPLLPSSPPPNVPEENIGTLELLVSEDGTVERVKLVSPGNRYHERMLVAHAKTWRFRPAMRDGQPVRYLTKVRLTI